MTFDARGNGVVTADRNLYTYQPKPSQRYLKFSASSLLN
jgi:hypothetical protein